MGIHTDKNSKPTEGNRTFHGRLIHLSGQGVHRLPLNMEIPEARKVLERFLKGVR